MAKKISLAVLVILTLLVSWFSPQVQAEEVQSVTASNGVTYSLAQNNQLRSGEEIIITKLSCLPTTRISWILQEFKCKSAEWVKGGTNGVVYQPPQIATEEQIRYHILLNLLALAIMLIPIWLMRGKSHVQTIHFAVSAIIIFGVTILGLMTTIFSSIGELSFSPVRFLLMCIIFFWGVYTANYCFRRLPKETYNASLILTGLMLFTLFLTW